MEVRQITPISALDRFPTVRVTPRETKVVTDEVAFENTRALRTALARQSDIRPDVVARAREWVADLAYPPMETIMKISHLLALHLTSDVEPTSKVGVQRGGQAGDFPN